MKTNFYNPSDLEVQFTEAVDSIKNELQKELKNLSILRVEKHLMEDNPSMVFVLEDKEGDLHQLVMKVVQRMDQ